MSYDLAAIISIAFIVGVSIGLAVAVARFNRYNPHIENERQIMRSIRILRHYRSMIEKED